MAKVLVGLVQRLLRRDDKQQKLMLCTVIATVGFAFPRLVWATYIGYTLHCFPAHPGDGGEQQRSELE